jgi:hypothetical protein
MPGRRWRGYQKIRRARGRVYQIPTSARRAAPREAIGCSPAPESPRSSGSDAVAVHPLRPGPLAINALVRGLGWAMPLRSRAGAAAGRARNAQPNGDSDAAGARGCSKRRRNTRGPELAAPLESRQLFVACWAADCTSSRAARRQGRPTCARCDSHFDPPALAGGIARWSATEHRIELQCGHRPRGLVR